MAEIKTIYGNILPESGGGGTNTTLELIADVTLSEEVTDVIIDQDLHGNPFECHECVCLLYGKPVETSEFIFAPNNIWTNGNYMSVGRGGVFNSGWKVPYIIDAVANNSVFFGKEVRDACYATFHDGSNPKLTKLTSFKFYCNKKFAIGTRIAIYKRS